MKFSNTKSIKYSLVTNGTLLKPDKLELLLKNKIDSFQITIDGMEKVHDALRKDITGKGSFTEIIENILYIQKYYETVNISINCNINSKNLNDISNFLKYIKTSKIKYPIFFSLIFDNGINSKLEVDDASLNWLKVHKEAIRYGYKFEPFYRDLFLGCAMTQRNYHIIGADGFLYKCINAVENPEYLLTKLSKYKTHEYEKKLNHFLNYKIDNVECEDCQFYPVCYGGCKYMNELNGFNCNKKMFNEIETNIIREIVNARNN